MFMHTGSEAVINGWSIYYPDGLNVFGFLDGRASALPPGLNNFRLGRPVSVTPIPYFN